MSDRNQNTQRREISLQEQQVKLQQIQQQMQQQVQQQQQMQQMQQQMQQQIEPQQQQRINIQGGEQMEPQLQMQAQTQQEIYQVPQIPFALIQQLSQMTQNKNDYTNITGESVGKQHWIRFNCRGTVIEANPSSVVRSKKIYDVITCKEWTPQSVWRLDVRSEDFHLFLDYLCGFNKNAIRNVIVAKLCEEFEVDIDIKRKINEELDNLVVEIATHVNKNKDAFALISIPLDKSKTIHSHCLQFLIPSQLIDKYSKYTDEIDELISNRPFLLDPYINFEKELKSIDGIVIPGKFKLIKDDENYYIEGECELLSSIISQISQIIKCGNFKLSERTNKMITSIKTECPIKWNGFLRNFNEGRTFDVFIPEYHWIQRPKPSIYPTISIHSHIVFNGISSPILNFVPDKNRIKGYEYSQYPQVRIIYDQNIGKCEIELYKLEWKIEDLQDIKKQKINNDEYYKLGSPLVGNTFAPNSKGSSNLNGRISSKGNETYRGSLIEITPITKLEGSKQVDYINQTQQRGRNIHIINDVDEDQDDIFDNDIENMNNYDHNRLRELRLFGLSSINNLQGFAHK